MKISTPKTVVMQIRVNSFRTPSDIREFFYNEPFVFYVGIIDYYQQPESLRYTVDLEVMIVFKQIKEFFDFVERNNDE